jgi:hypothetical protein
MVVDRDYHAGDPAVEAQVYQDTPDPGLAGQRQHMQRGGAEQCHQHGG